MALLRDIFLDPDERACVGAAETMFNNLCAQAGSAAAEVYATRPVERAAVWKEIRSRVIEIVGFEGTARVLEIRKALADEIDATVFAHFYLNLSDEERDLISRNIFSSTSEEQDKLYFFAHPRHLALATVLEGMFYYGWSGSEEAKENVREVQRAFIEQCQEHCQLILKIARARENGTDLTESEKKQGELVVMMKDLTRRGLAGEKLD